LPTTHQKTRSRISPMQLDAAALCTTHIFENRAQFCTNENPRRCRNLRITLTNYYYLDKIGCDSQNCAHPSSCAPPPPIRRSLAFMRGPMFFLYPCTVLHKRKTPTDATPSRNPNKPLPLTRNSVRFAKPRDPPVQSLFVFAQCTGREVAALWERPRTSIGSRPPVRL
jgi:hypothetical protein